MQEAIHNDATSVKADLSGVTCPVFDVATPSTGGTPAGTSTAGLDPAPAIAPDSQPTKPEYKAPPPHVASPQLTTPPPTTSTPPEQIQPAKAQPLAPPARVGASTAFVGPRLVPLCDDRQIGGMARSPCVSVPSSTKSVPDNGHTRSMDAIASKVKGDMLKLHADEAGVVNSTLVEIRFDVDKLDTQMVRVVETCATNTSDIETIRVTAGRDHAAHTQRMDALTKRSMDDSRDTAGNKTAITELDTDLKRIESESITRTSVGLNGQQENLTCEVGKLNHTISGIATREDNHFQAFQKHIDEHKDEAEHFKGTIAKTSEDLRATLVEQFNGSIEKTSEDLHATLTTEVDNLNGALDRLSAQQDALTQAYHNNSDHSHSEMRNLTGSLEKTRHDQDTLHSYVHGELADHFRNMEPATKNVKSLIEEPSGPDVVASNATADRPASCDGTCATAKQLTDTCKRLDNIEKCLDDGTANEAIARVDVVERQLVTLQHVQDDDRLRSKDAKKSLERFITSVGHDATVNSTDLKRCQEWQHDNQDLNKLRRHVGGTACTVREMQGQIESMMQQNEDLSSAVAVLTTQNQMLEQQMVDVASSLVKAQALELQVADLASSLKKAQAPRWTCWAAIGPLLACSRT